MNTVNMPKTNQIRGELLFDVALTAYNTWGVGGHAECLFKPADLDDLTVFLANTEPETSITWLGLGSNVLIRDAGISGIVIITQGGLDRLEISEDGHVAAQAGVACAKLARQTSRKGFAGLEFMAGIPGTVGGALAMNAGAYGTETWQHLTKVDVVNRAGQIKTKSVDQYEVGYRYVKQSSSEWFVTAYFELKKISEIENVRSIKELLQHRSESQPIGKKNCGSVFRNPPGDHAARLIEEAGLKGFSIGGASISSKHANFIINEGAASADDLERLILKVQEVVFEQYKIKLIPEVKFLGDAT